MGNSDPNRTLRHGLALVATGFGIGRPAGRLVSLAIFMMLTSLTTTIAVRRGVKAALRAGESLPTMRKRLLNFAVKPFRESPIIMTNTHPLATLVEEVLCAVV